jgi:hypothetical protein
MINWIKILLHNLSGHIQAKTTVGFSILSKKKNKKERKTRLYIYQIKERKETKYILRNNIHVNICYQ